MTDEGIALALLNKLLDTGTPIDATVDITRDERGMWTLVCYNEELRQYSAVQIQKFMLWLLHVASRATQADVPTRVARV